jgi:hypothetical protein
VAGHLPTGAGDDPSVAAKARHVADTGRAGGLIAEVERLAAGRRGEGEQGKRRLTVVRDS